MAVNPAQAMTQVTGYQGDAGLGQSQQWGFGFVGQALAGVNRRAQEKQLLEMQIAQQNEQQTAQQQAQQQQVQQGEQFLQGVFTNLDQFVTEQEVAPYQSIPGLGYLADETVDPETGRPKSFARFARERRDAGSSDDQIEDEYVWARTPEKVQIVNQNAVAGTVLQAGGLGLDNEVMRGLDQSIGHLPVDIDEAGESARERWKSRTEGIRGPHVFKELTEAGIIESVVSTYGADPATVQGFMPAIMAIKDQPQAAVDKALGAMFGAPIQKQRTLGPEQIQVTPGTRTLPVKGAEGLRKIAGNLDVVQIVEQVAPDKVPQLLLAAESVLKNVKITVDETGTEMFLSIPGKELPGFDFLSQVPLSTVMDPKSFQDLLAGSGKAATGGTITGRERGVAPAQAVTAPGGAPAAPQTIPVIPPTSPFLHYQGAASNALMQERLAEIRTRTGLSDEEWLRRSRETRGALQERTEKEGPWTIEKALEAQRRDAEGPDSLDMMGVPKFPLDDDPDMPDWLKGRAARDPLLR